MWLQKTERQKEILNITNRRKIYKIGCLLLTLDKKLSQTHIHTHTHMVVNDFEVDWNQTGLRMWVDNQMDGFDKISNYKYLACLQIFQINFCSNNIFVFSVKLHWIMCSQSTAWKTGLLDVTLSRQNTHRYVKEEKNLIDYQK